MSLKKSKAVLLSHQIHRVKAEPEVIHGNLGEILQGDFCSWLQGDVPPAFLFRFFLFSKFLFLSAASFLPPVASFSQKDSCMTFFCDVADSNAPERDSLAALNNQTPPPRAGEANPEGVTGSCWRARWRNLGSMILVAPVQFAPSECQTWTT